ncbi:MAG: hypothetical protein WCG01_03515 [bacterium]
MKRGFYLAFIVALVLMPLLFSQAATLFLAPQKINSDLHKSFSLNVLTSSQDQAINAVSGSIYFPNDKLVVESLTVGGSVVNFWLKEPSFSNATGVINFEGIALNPGYQGVGGRIFSIHFKVKSVGEATLKFASGSILANDGQASEILSGTGDAQILITDEKSNPAVAASTSLVHEVAHVESPKIESSEIKSSSTGILPTLPVVTSTMSINAAQWNNDGKLSSNWVLPPAVTGVSYLLDQKPDTVPDTKSEGMVSSYLQNVHDGTWYLHIRYKNKNGWGEVIHKKIAVDRVPPANFVAKILDGQKTYNQEPNVFLAAEDNLSGLDYFRGLINGQEIFKVATSSLMDNLFKLPVLPLGQSKIDFEVFDLAGNRATTSTELLVEAIEVPVFEYLPKVITTRQVLVVSGHTLPRSLVEIQLIGPENEQVVIKSSDTGKFTYIKNKLPAGNYKIAATTLLNSSQKSAASQFVTFKVKSFWLADVFFNALGAVAFYLPIIILFIMLALLLVVVKLYAFKRRVLLEVKIAENVLSNSHQIINYDLSKIIDFIAKAKQKRKLTLEEQRTIRELKNKLKYTEHFIDKVELPLKSKVNRASELGVAKTWVVKRASATRTKPLIKKVKS